MTLMVLFVATLFLAYANGANDNAKGVATLIGSGVASYRQAMLLATLATAAGCVASVFLAADLVRAFSGSGLVPDAVAGSPRFLLAVAAGAAGTVLLATVLALPISTTHALTGALVGAGLLATAGDVRFVVLGKAFVLPLLLSPPPSPSIARWRGTRRGAAARSAPCLKRSACASAKCRRRSSR